MSVGNHAMIENNFDINVTFFYSKICNIGWMGVHILRGHYFLNEFGDIQFFSSI